MFLAPCPGEAAAESGDETDYPFNDDQRYQDKFWAWLQSPRNFCSQACVTGGPTQQMPKAELVESHDGPLVPKVTRKLSMQVDASCGDLAVEDKPGTPLAFKEGSQEPIVFSEFKGYDQPAEVEKLNEDDERDKTEMVAKNEGTEAKNKVDVNGERTAEQQDDMHKEGIREFKTMLAEDFQSWCMCERQRVFLKSPAAVSSLPSEETPATAAQMVANAGLGRVILEAKLSCKDEAGIDAVLEQRLLQLHLFQLEKDAARCFLEECNGLTPRLVRRYLQPLSSWLKDRVQAASSEIACDAHKVEGDLEQIKCWYQSHV